MTFNKSAVNKDNDTFCIKTKGAKTSKTKRNELIIGMEIKGSVIASNYEPL